MRKNRSSSSALKLEEYAPLFAALGDETRLKLVQGLVGGEMRSISSLTEGTKLTRQAVTKHLQVLEDVGLVGSQKTGRENLYSLKLEPMGDLQEFLILISAQWDDALARLKLFIEE